MSAIGIDLGTTNSAVAIVLEGQPRLVPDGSGDVLLPSVVGFDAEGRTLVGRAARNQVVVAPERTVRSVKRAMGTDATFSVGGRDWTPVEVSALILRSLVDRVEASTGARPARAVITVPAFFTDAQRQATRDAGELAGLEVLRLVNEPTAAALTYAAEREEMVVVFDLGGGTFDVSVVERGPDFTEVRASHGDTHLGGDDLDVALARALAAEWGHPEVEQDRLGWERLVQAAERAKIALSERNTVKVQETWLLGDLHLDVVLTREALEEVVRPLLLPTLEHLATALEQAGVAAADVDRVLLVGGATRMPLVRQILEEALPAPVHADVDPDAAVALGAGLLAARLAGEEVDALLVDVTPHSLCAGMSHGHGDPTLYAEVIIARNTVVPVTRSRVGYTHFPGQPQVRIPIGQGEGVEFDDLTRLGEVVLTDLDPRAGIQPIDIRYHLDASGVLTVHATERLSGKDAQVRIADSPYALSERRRAGSAAAVDRASTAPAEGLEEVREVAARMLLQASKARGGDEAALARMNEAAAELARALDGGDAAAISRATDTLADRLLDMV
ncbi:Hsp70 family protein [Myxococcota bacterium]|nr:Hsp70 family protein [Myxococcota bacterium]